MAANISFSLANFAQGYCPTTWQQFATDLVALITGSLAGDFTGVIMGASLPAVEDQDKVWVRLDANGYIEGIYRFQGVWSRPHPVAASSNQVIMWKGTEAQLWSFDGGDGTDPEVSAPTATTGAMWQVDTDFSFRFPLGIGHDDTATNATSYDGSATSLAHPATGGAEKLEITMADYFAHDHCFGRFKESTNDDAMLLKGDAPTVASGATREVPGEADEVRTSDVASGTGDWLITGAADWADGATSDPINIMPPYRTVIFARRTSRQFLTVTS